MLLELMVLLVPGGVILLYDGWRKRRKKEYFVHSPVSSWLLGLLPFYPLYFQLDSLLGTGLDGSKILLVLGFLIVILGAIIFKTYYEITHRRINIHNMDKGQVKKLLEKLMTKHRISFEKDSEPSGKVKYTFEDTKGKITLEPHLTGGNHQVLTLAKISEIPKGHELMEDIKEGVMEVDRTFSKTLGVAEMVTGIALLSLALYLV